MVTPSDMNTHPTSRRSPSDEAVKKLVSVNCGDELRARISLRDTRSHAIWTRACQSRQGLCPFSRLFLPFSFCGRDFCFFFFLA